MTSVRGYVTLLRQHAEREGRTRDVQYADAAVACAGRLAYPF
jgi:hypothetical protein